MDSSTCCSWAWCRGKHTKHRRHHSPEPLAQPLIVMGRAIRRPCPHLYRAYTGRFTQSRKEKGCADRVRSVHKGNQDNDYNLQPATTNTKKLSQRGRLIRVNHPAQMYLPKSSHIYEVHLKMSRRRGYMSPRVDRDVSFCVNYNTRIAMCADKVEKNPIHPTNLHSQAASRDKSK